MRHQRLNRTGVERSADRADDVVRGRLERAADACLDDHDGRKHGPEPMRRNTEEVRQTERQQRIDGSSNAEAQAWIPERVVGHVASPASPPRHRNRLPGTGWPATVRL